MTSSPDPRDRGTTPTSANLQAASEQLRDRSRQRAVEIANDVLHAALRSQRRALPVAGAPPHDYVRVSDRVIITLLRRNIDAALHAAAVGRVHLVVDRSHKLREITIELYVQYGQVLVDVADQARSVADDVLGQLLAGPTVSIDVVTSHVHVSDITAGDPHLVDPTDDPHA